eukprot:Awhi_evm1s1360
MESSVKSASAVVAMVMISPLLTLYSSAVIPAVVGGAAIYGPFIKKLSRQHLDAVAASTHMASERFSNFTTVFLSGQKPRELKRYNTIIDDSYIYAKRVAVFQGMYLGSSFFVGNATLLAVVWLGGGMVLEGVVTTGQLTSFCMYAGLLAGSVSEVTESAAGFLRAQGSGARLFALLETTPHLYSGTQKLPPGYKGEIAFENVHFSYPEHQEILRNLNFRVHSKELVGLTGRSGCGKSTVISLLQRLYEPQQGRITIDGVDIKDLDISWLHAQMGNVRQESALFAGTVRENICYGKPEATEEEIETACKLAHAHAFIQNLSQGYDTTIGEKGASLSGGQKQRLAIARALLVRPRFLLLDESTSALDDVCEKEVLASLKELKEQEGITTLMVAHQASTLSAMEKVVLLEKGSVVDEGLFSSLKERKLL